MEPLTAGVVIALLAVLAAEFVNGWTDAPNAIATVVSTGVMTPRSAILMAVVLNTVTLVSAFKHHTATLHELDPTLSTRA